MYGWSKVEATILAIGNTHLWTYPCNRKGISILAIIKFLILDLIIFVCALQR